jgi:hypothetical protein
MVDVSLGWCSGQGGDGQPRVRVPCHLDDFLGEVSETQFCAVATEEIAPPDFRDLSDWLDVPAPRHREKRYAAPGGGAVSLPDFRGLSLIRTGDNEAILLALCASLPALDQLSRDVKNVE